MQRYVADMQLRLDQVRALVFRDARAGSVMGPADDIRRVLIGQRALGLPYPWE